MTRVFSGILVVGLGNVGELLARMLHRGGFAVTGADVAPATVSRSL